MSISRRPLRASLYDLKPRFQQLVHPAARALVARGITANQVTLTALGGSVLVGVIVGMSGSSRLLLLLAPAWLLARMALNAVDGIMAAEFDQKSTLGAILNEVGDVVSDLAIYLPLAIAFDDVAAPAMAFAVGAVLTEFCGVLPSALGGVRRYDGPMGKSDRAFVFGLIALVMALSARMSGLVGWVLWVAVALEGLTCVNRVRSGVGDIEMRIEARDR